NQMKRLAPQVPVIFGGWHASLLPEQTVREPYVDMVVRGQGELTLLEIVENLTAGRDHTGIPGTNWRRGGDVHRAPERPVASLDSLPMPAFHLADMDAYERACGVRKLAYATSVGCPYACNYCTDMVFYKRRFHGLSAERVAGELAALVPRYRIAE